MSLVFRQTDTDAPLGVLQACAPVAPAGDADAKEAVVGGTAGVTAEAVSIPSEGTVTCYADELRIADTDSLDAGTLVHRFNVSTAQADLTLEEIYVCRVNSSGVSQETLGSETGLATDIAAGGVFTTNITLAAASAHNAGDRVYIVVVVSNAHTHTARSLEVLPDQNIDTPFVAEAGDVTVTVPLGGAVWAGAVPTVALGPWSATVGVAAALWAGFAPTVTVDGGGGEPVDHGYTTVGTSTATAGSNTIPTAIEFDATGEDGEFQSFSLWTRHNGTPDDVRAGLYVDDGAGGWDLVEDLGVISIDSGTEGEFTWPSASNPTLNAADIYVIRIVHAGGEIWYHYDQPDAGLGDVKSTGFQSEPVSDDPSASMAASLTSLGSAQSLTLTGWITYTPAAAGVTVDVPVGGATWAGLAPSVELGPWSATVGIAEATWTGFAPTVTASDHVSVEVPVGGATWAGAAPAVGLGPWSATPGPAEATWAGFAPLVELGPWSAVVPVGGATWTGFAPSLTAPVAIAVPVGGATWAGFAPSVAVSDHVSVEVPTGGATWTGLAPALEFGPWSQTVDPAEATWTGFAPTVSADASVTVEVPVGGATYAGLAPAVELGPWSATPATAEATWTGFAPTVTADASVTVEVPAGGASWAGQAPEVQLGPWSATVPAGDATWEGFAPTVTVGDAVTIEVPAGAATWAGLAPSVELGPWSQTVAPAEATWAGLAPTVTVTADVALEVPVGGATWQGFEPTVNDGSGRSPTLRLPLAGTITQDRSGSITTQDRSGTITQDRSGSLE